MRIVKRFKAGNFDGAWDEIEANKCFQRQSWTKYLRQTFDFM